MLQQYYCMKDESQLYYNNNEFFLVHKGHTQPPILINKLIAVLLQQMDGTNTLEKCIQNLSRLLRVEKETIANKIGKIVISLSGYLDVLDHPSSKKEILINSSELPEYINYFSTSESILQKSTVPQLLNFNITDHCSRHCIYCYTNSFYADKIDSSNRFLSPSRFQEIIQEAEEIGIQSIEVGGGDPFRHIHILDYIYTLTHSNIPNILVSTKSFITNELAKQLKQLHLENIQVSLDSADPIIADQLMGRKNSFYEVTQTIQNLVTNHIKVNVNAVVTSKNITGITQLIDYLEALHVDSVSLNFYGLSCGRHRQELFPSLTQIHNMKSQLASLRQQDYSIQLPDIEINEDYYKNKVCSDLEIKSHYRSYCGALKNRIIVNQYAKVCYCAYIPNVKELELGDLHEQGLMEIWNSQPVQDILSPSREKYINTECYECNKFYSCYPKRCFLRSVLEYNTPYQKDPLCIFGNAAFKDC